MDRPGDLDQALDKALGGDEGAWRYIEEVVREQVIERLKLGPRIDREELTTEVMSALWEGLPKLRKRSAFLRYAKIVARRTIRRKLDAEERYKRLFREPAAPGEGTNVGLANLQGEELLAELQATLNAADRILFRLLYVVGASNPEAGSRLGIPPDALRKRRHRLNLKLRRAARRYDRFDEFDEDEPA